jgi:cobalt-precorrin 5A hydrolase
MTFAVLTLSSEGLKLAELIASKCPETLVYVHDQVEIPVNSSAIKFTSVVDLTAQIFNQYRGLVYIMPCGVVVRAIAPLIRHKTEDPAVVAVDVAGRWAISLLSGHEGGANDLALEIGNILSAEPIITTTTEALKTLIVGIGCRRGTDAQRILDAVHGVLSEAHLSLDDVRLLASADLKADETGLIDAARTLGIPLRFISSQELNDSPRGFEESDFVRQKVDLPAVAEPCALLAGRRTTLLVRKQIHNGVTVAVARENSLW